MTSNPNIETVLQRNEAWLKEFDMYAAAKKAPLLYVDMQSPSVNHMFSELVQKLETEKRTFMLQRLQQNVPDVLAEKEMLQTYQRIILSESRSPPKPKLSKYMCFRRKETGKINTVNYFDRIKQQLPYYDT
jgi:hypothetical protein